MKTLEKINHQDAAAGIAFQHFSGEHLTCPYHSFVVRGPSGLVHEGTMLAGL